MGKELQLDLANNNATNSSHSHTLTLVSLRLGAHGLPMQNGGLTAQPETEIENERKQKSAKLGPATLHSPKRESLTQCRASPFIEQGEVVTSLHHD